MPWTASKAEVRSSKTRTVNSPESAAIIMSLDTLRKAVSVECILRKPRLKWIKTCYVSQENKEIGQLLLFLKFFIWKMVWIWAVLWLGGIQTGFLHYWFNNIFPKTAGNRANWNCQLSHRLKKTMNLVGYQEVLQLVSFWLRESGCPCH